MDAREELRYAVLAAQREGNRQLTEALRPLDLTPSQAEVIQVLAQYQPMTLLQLGERLICETGSPSRLVKSMVEAGWVEKLANPDDGRAVLLRLTGKSESILPALNAIQSAFNEAVFAGFSEKKTAKILAALWELIEDTPGGSALRRRKLGK